MFFYTTIPLDLLYKSYLPKNDILIKFFKNFYTSDNKFFLADSGVTFDGTNFTTGNHNDDIKYSIGVSPSMKFWKERGVAS